MGICKCKKRTDLFCFVHKKAVCEQCLLEDHGICIIKTYVDWLTDSEYEPPSCGICKEAITQDNFIRLTCLDLFHPECLDVHAASLPPHTAKAGYFCPSCSKPMFPPEANNPLIRHFEDYVSKTSWGQNLLTSNHPKEQEFSFQKEQDPSTEQQLSSGGSIQQEPFAGIASRKPLPRDHAIVVNDDFEDEDKYRKRSVTQLLAALGLMKQAPTKESHKRRLRMDSRRVLILLALVIFLATVLFLGLSLTTEAEQGNQA